MTTDLQDTQKTLKPCPFCGGQAKVFNLGDGLPNIGNRYAVGCEDKKCLGAQNGRMWFDKDKAIEAWNRRTE